MRSRLHCAQHKNFIYVLVFMNSGILIVRFYFHVTFETFNFFEWQVVAVVEATFFHSSDISFINFSRKEFILREHDSLQLWQAFVTLCVDIKSVSPIRRSVQISYTGKTLICVSGVTHVSSFSLTSCQILVQTSSATTRFGFQSSS